MTSAQRLLGSPKRGTLVGRALLPGGGMFPAASLDGTMAVSSSSNEDTELVALVTWLQSFSAFPHRIVDGHDGKVALDTVLDALSALATARSIAKVAEEITGSKETATDGPSADDIWTSLLILTSTRARPLAESPMTDRKQMSPTRLKLYVLSNLLDCAVQCPDLAQRREYIENIMQLNKGVQKTLMSLIEKRTKAGKKTPSKSSTDSRSSSSDSKRPSSKSRSHERRTESTQQHTTPPRSSLASRITSNSYHTPERETSHGRPPSDSSTRSRTNSSPSGYTPATSRRRIDALLTPNTMDSPNAIQTIVNDLHSRNETLAKMVDTYKKREAELQNNLDTIHGDYRKQMLRLENSQRDHVQEIHDSYTQQIESLTNELKRYQALAEQGERAMKELEATRDELDVLQHSQSVLQETQEKLRRYKEKVSELQDVRDAYQMEQERHARSIEECIILTNEVKELKVCKHQLEDYKNRALQAEVKLVECQDYLRQLEEQTNQQSATNEVLMKGALMQQEQLEEMRRRMEREAEELQVHGPGVGEGVNEFNSDVAKELARLRNENTQLKVFAAKREHDAVERLEATLDDAKRLAEQYKKEFLTANQNFKTTQISLNESQARETSLKDEIERFQQMLSELEQGKELLQKRLDRCEERLSSTQDQLKEAEQRLVTTRDELDQWQERARKTEQESSERLQMWQAAQRELEETNLELEATGQMVLELEERLSNKEVQAVKMMQLEKELRETIREKDAAIAESQKLHEDKEQSLRESHQRNNHLAEELQSTHDTVNQMKLENSKLSSIVEREREARNRAITEAKASNEALLSRHERELEQMQGTMNCRLDDERRASRRRDEENQRKLAELDENWRTEYDSLEKRLQDAIKQTQQETQRQIEALKQEHSEELQKYRAEAEQSRNNLMEQGNRMIEETKSKAQLQIQIHEENLRAAIQEKEDVEKLLRNKIDSLKGRLDHMSSQYYGLDQENEDLKSRLADLERENREMRDDNERYKRQLGGHYGIDGSVQAQLEKLQMEYTALLQENRNLRREGRHNLDTDSSASLGPDLYNRVGKRNENYLHQLRREYEEQIHALNDEKRELLMKASAAAVEVQRAEERAAKREDELDRLRAEMTEMKLVMYRQENFSDRFGASRSTVEGRLPVEDASFLSDKNSSFHTAHCGTTPTQYKSPERSHLSTSSRSPSVEKAIKNRESHEKNLRSRISMLTKHSPPPPPPKNTPPSRSTPGNIPSARTASGQRFRSGTSLLDADFNSSHMNILSPTNKHEQQANQQQHQTKPSPDFLGLNNQFQSSSVKSRQSTTLSDVTRWDQGQRSNPDEQPECRQS